MADLVLITSSLDSSKFEEFKTAVSKLCKEFAVETKEIPIVDGSITTKTTDNIDDNTFHNLLNEIETESKSIESKTEETLISTIDPTIPPNLIELISKPVEYIMQISLYCRSKHILTKNKPKLPCT